MNPRDAIGQQGPKKLRSSGPRQVVHDTRKIDPPRMAYGIDGTFDVAVIPYCKTPGWVEKMLAYYWEYVPPETETTCQACIKLAKVHADRDKRLARRKGQLIPTGNASCQSTS